MKQAAEAMEQVRDMALDLKNGKNGTRKALMWIAIIGILIGIASGVGSFLSDYFRNDFEIKRLCAQVEKNQLSIENMKLDSTKFKAEMDVKMHTVEVKVDKLSDDMEEMKQYLSVLKSIDKRLKTIAGGSN